MFEHLSKFDQLGIAMAVAVQMESVAPSCGFHIGLTGGVLYKEGSRKDIDYVVYDIDNENGLSDKYKFLSVFEDKSGFKVLVDYGYVVKMRRDNINIDLLFVNHEGNYKEDS